MESRVKLDRYKLLQKIGEGAYGKVYRALGNVVRYFRLKMLD